MSLHDPRPEAGPCRDERERRTRQAVSDVRSGDPEAYGRIVELYKGPVMSLCTALTRDLAAAEDLAQETFFRAYQYLRGYDDRRPFYPWLAKIACQLARTRWGRRDDVSFLEPGELTGRASDRDGDSPLADLIAREEATRLWGAVSSLPAGERTVSVLYYRDGLTIRGVAEVMGVSPGTVKTLLFRARRHLLSAMSLTAVRPETGSER